MKLRREFPTSPRLVLEVEEDTKIVLFYYSIKNQSIRLASMVNAFVKRPETVVQKKIAAVKQFLEMDVNEAIESARRVGLIDENQIIKINKTQD